MEFTITREPFLKILSRIQGVVERRNTMPILAYTLLEANKKEGITLSATDLEVSLRTRTKEVVVKQPAVAALPARKLHDIVRELPEGGEIHLRQEQEGRFLLSCGRARFTLASMPAEDFPQLPSAEGGVRIPMSGPDLRVMFNKTHFAMSQDDTRFTLNGIFVQIEPAAAEGERSMIRMVATDTHRLAMAEFPVSEQTAEEVGVIIPRKAVGEIRRILDEDDLPVEMIFGQNHIQFIKEEITLVSKLVEGRFPNYKRVIPENNKSLLSVEKSPFQGVIKRMMVLANEKSRGINLNISDAQITVSTNNPELEVAEEEIVCNLTGGKTINIGFNARYLQEIIMALEGETVRMALRNDEAPALITDPERDHYLFVLMPMRV